MSVTPGIIFSLSDSEWEAYSEFNKDHGCPRGHEPYTGAIGGQYEFRFFPTSLGSVCRVLCTLCNVEKDVTNYGEW